MTGVAQKCLELGCDELFCRGDNLGCGFRKSLLRANFDGVGRETQPLDGHPHGRGGGRHDHEAVSDASELSVVDEQMVDVLENNFLQARCVEGVSLVLAAHRTSPAVGVQFLSDGDTFWTARNENRFRVACEQFSENPKSPAAQAELSSLVVGTQSTTSDPGIFCPCDQAHNVTDQDICGYAKWRRG